MPKKFIIIAAEQTSFYIYFSQQLHCKKLFPLNVCK